MIPLAVPNLSAREGALLEECMRTNMVSSIGPFVPRFESMAAQLSRFDHAVATNTGTSALHVALIGLGIEPGDLVVIPSYTFIGTANAVSMCGADPWLMDIEEESWGLDPVVLQSELLRNTVTRGGRLLHASLGRRVAAIVAVCAAGQPPQITSIREIATSYGIPLLVDAAGAAGVGYHGDRLGGAAEHATLSFNGNKTFTSGGGGMFLTQDENLAAQVRHLCSTARTEQSYVHDKRAFNYTLTNIQAALGCAQLEQADRFLARKREIDWVYRRSWDPATLAPFPRTDWAESTCWMTGGVLRRETRSGVEELVASLAEKKIQARSFWRPIHIQVPYSMCPRSEMRVSDDIWPRVVTLPSSTSLTEAEQEYVIRNVRECLGTN